MDKKIFEAGRRFEIWRYSTSYAIFPRSYIFFFRYSPLKYHSRKNGISEVSWSSKSLILNYLFIENYTMTNILIGGYQ